jgi:secondary thiamine-phosphate synthase enzyme
VFIHHTSASLLITENADPAVHRDLERFLARLVPDGDPMFEHDAEGPDDMPAHARAMLTTVELSIPVTGGDLALGTWQGVYVYEHRTAPHRRRLTVTVLGEGPGRDSARPRAPGCGWRSCPSAGRPPRSRSCTGSWSRRRAGSTSGVSCTP